MKKKTLNAQRRTPNLEFRADRVLELPYREYASAQKPKYDLEERLLNFSASIVRLADSLPNTKAGNHISGQLHHLQITAKSKLLNQEETFYINFAFA
jgi:hypothetical protein